MLQGELTTGRWTRSLTQLLYNTTPTPMTHSIDFLL